MCKGRRKASIVAAFFFCGLGLWHLGHLFSLCHAKHALSTTFMNLQLIRDKVERVCHPRSVGNGSGTFHFRESEHSHISHRFGVVVAAFQRHVA
uniref:Putative secreted protein n=1 Tax=Ixodes ricinus TaxID=34613 RepID=A0A6B0U2T6_IXORI